MGRYTSIQLNTLDEHKASFPSSYSSECFFHGSSNVGLCMQNLKRVLCLGLCLRLRLSKALLLPPKLADKQKTMTKGDENFLSLLDYSSQSVT